MISILFGILLLISIAIIIYMAQKNYENVDIRYWSIVVIVPVIIGAYWFKSMATTVEGAVISMCFIYLDSTVLLTLAIFCIMHFMHIQPKRWMKVLAYSLAFAHMAMVCLCFNNDLYYKRVTIYTTVNGTVTKMTPGPLKIIHWIYLGLILAVIVTLLIVAILRKGTYSRRTLWLYSSIAATGLVIYAVETLANVNFSTLPILYVLADIMIASNYDHAHMHDISGLISEQQEILGDRAYFALDLAWRFLGCNNITYEIFPSLRNQRIDEELLEGAPLTEGVVKLIKKYNAGEPGSKLFSQDDREYRIEISGFTLRRGGKNQGYLFEVRDVTEEEEIKRKIREYNKTLEHDVDERTEHIREIQRKVVTGLANMIDNRDNSTGGHVKRTSDIIGFIVDSARKQGIYDISEEYAEDIVRAAPMHDLGKINIDNSILLKPGKLTDEEYEIMKTHSSKSADLVNMILKDVEEDRFVKVAYNVAKFHHERWDGKGYPEGRAGDSTPLEARLMAIADVYDALVSERCYKKPLSFDKAAEIMLEGMGTQFDPDMSKVFTGCQKQLEEYYMERKKEKQKDSAGFRL